MGQSKDNGRVKLLEDENTTLTLKRQDAGTILSDVDVILAENGITISLHHPDRQALGLAMLRAQINASAAIRARRSGKPVETPDRPAPLVVAPLQPKGPTLSAMRQRWIELIGPGRKATDDNQLYVDAFIEIVGDLPVAAVTRTMIRDFRDLLKKRPRNMPREIRKLPLPDQVAWGAKQPGCKLLTPHTVNAKGIGSLSSLFETAKADDLIDKLIEAAKREVDSRHEEATEAERLRAATAIAIGALRYFMLKYTRNSVIAFDFQEALSFTGETGPYLLYAAVRIRKLLQKLDGALPDFKAKLGADAFERQLADEKLWQHTLAATLADTAVERALNAGEPAHMARYAFQLAQSYNLFYHDFPVLDEQDEEKRVFLLWLTDLFRSQLARALHILGIEIPAFM